MKLLKDLEDYIAVPERPKPPIDAKYPFETSTDKSLATGYEKDLKEWQQKYAPTELIEWKRFEDIIPEIGTIIYWKYKNGDYYEFDVTKKLTVQAWKGYSWCCATEYEQAKAIENQVNCLGDGWIFYKEEGFYQNGRFDLTHSDEYFYLELDATKVLATWHESICTPNMVRDVIEDKEAKLKSS
jgi:hypothetical protein